MSLFEDITGEFIKIEASGRRGIRYHFYKGLLLINSKYLAKRSRQKYFWKWGRFKLPPYWWRTKTFKCLTVGMVAVTVGVLGVYYLSQNSAETIVSDISTDFSEDSVVTDSSVEVFVDDRPKSIRGELALDDGSGNLSYNFLYNNLSDAVSRNGDTVGWIRVGYCGIDYHVVQSVNNDWYLHHDFNGGYNSHGWIFLDYRCRGEEPLLNTVIYGHTLFAGGMFTPLASILDATEPVYVQYQTKKFTYIYEVISVYQTEPEPSYIRQSFTVEELEDFHQTIKRKNEWTFAPNVDLSVKDSILTLSTCTGDNKRLAVHCRLIVSAVFSGVDENESGITS